MLYNKDMNRRFLITLLTLFVIGTAASVAIFLAKGYRLSPTTGTVSGTGILSIISVPDQASVYLDGHLTSATNTNINSLPPKKYRVKIVKERFISWEKEVEVKMGLVSEVKATLFPAIPSTYPLTYAGVENVSLSPDGQTLVYVVKPSDSNDGSLLHDKKSGIWAWQMSEKQIAFARSGEPHQIAYSISGIDFTKAALRFAPDSNQVLVILPDRSLLLDMDKLNDPPRDITATVGSKIKTWDEDEKVQEQTRLQLIRDLSLRNTASGAAVLKWSPDETKMLYSEDGKKDFRIVDLSTKKSYNLAEYQKYIWLPDSEHLIIVESGQNQTAAKISIIEYDGSNKSEIFAGNFDTDSVFPWPDSSRLVIVSSLPTATASQPNLFGVNLK